MKSLKKYISLLAVAALAGGSVACSDDGPEYEPALPVPDNCMQVYFSAENTSEYTFPTTDDISEMAITLTLCRTKSDAAASVPVKMTSGEELFNAPATAEFAAGQTETSIVVTPREVQAGVTGFALAIEGDQFVDPYTQLGSPMIGITVDFELWDRFDAVNHSYWGVDYPLTLEHKVGSNLWRLSNLYDGDPGFSFTVVEVGGYPEVVPEMEYEEGWGYWYYTEVGDGVNVPDQICIYNYQEGMAGYTTLYENDRVMYINSYDYDWDWNWFNSGYQYYEISW